MPNTIIRASAGSGKTFQLSNRYLDIVFHREPVDTILASTFTRKAAGEITSRILMRLAEAALDDDKRRELGKFIELPQPIQLLSASEVTKNNTGKPEEAETLLYLLADLARNMYRLRIGTIDSFFNKLATAFSLELGLPPGWSILDDGDYSRYINETVRTVLSGKKSSGERHRRRSDARRLMNMLQKGEQDRNVTRELFDLAKDLLPVVRESPAEAWNHEHLLRKELDEAEFRGALARLETAVVPANQKNKPDGRFVNARAALGTHAGNGDWRKFLKSSLVQSVIADECLYYKIPVEGDLLYAVRELIDQAHAEIVNKLVAQTKATRELLELVAEAYDEILLRERRFRFEDITRRLGGGDFSAVLDVLDHRLDSRTAHLLLDEFQDTSMSQWNVMAAFAADVARNPVGSFFCVGDVKQAIYAWRGGESGIFGTIEHAIPHIEKESLDVSFRSSPAVLAAVNRLFETIVDNPALEEKFGEATETWSDGFSFHKEAEKNKNLPAHVILEAAPEASEDPDDSDEDVEDDASDGETDGPVDDRKTIFLRYTIDRIRRLHETRPGMSIGVLVNRNDKIGPIIAGLKRSGIEASEEGGVPLTDSAAVQCVLSAMILADHPGDRIARFHLSKGPLADCLGIHDHDDDFQAVHVARKLRADLLQHGYGAVVERLARELAAACNPREFQRLEKLRKLAYRFEETASCVRTRRFVDVVRNTKVENASAAQIRVMTIHKSKGLEFDIVVLPDLDKKLVRSTPAVVTDRKSLADPIHLAVRFVGEEVQALLPDDYQEAFRKRIQAEAVESLSLLYVAMTRAIHELVMIVPPLGKTAKRNAEKGEPSFSANFAGVLRAGLSISTVPGDAEPADSNVIYEDFGGNFKGFLHFLKEKIVRNDMETGSEPELIEVALAKTSKKPRRNLPRFSPSGMESPAATKRSAVVETLAAHGRNPDDARLRGTAIHACFEHGLKRNPWLDAGMEFDKEMLANIVRRAVLGKRGNVNIDEVVGAFLEICRKPTVRKTLALKSYKLLPGQSARAEHERRFAVRTEEGRILHGNIDRLVVIEEDGKIVGLDIIDYKTDMGGDGRTAESLAQERGYLEQIAAYRHGMSKLFGLDEKKIGARLLFVELDETVEIRPKPLA